MEISYLLCESSEFTLVVINLLHSHRASLTVLHVNLFYNSNFPHIFIYRVVKICPNQMKVKYRLWKGRVHCTFARDEVEEQDDEVVSSNLSSKSLTKLRRGVFYGRSPGETMTARVIKIRECQILG